MTTRDLVPLRTAMCVAVLLASLAGCAGGAAPAPAPTAAAALATSAATPARVSGAAGAPAAPSPAPVQPSPAAAPGEPPAQVADTVLRYFALVDDGKYEEAAPIAVMPRWALVGLRSYQSAGLASKEEFVRFQEMTAGINGGNIAIRSIGVTGARTLALKDLQPADYPELFGLAALPGRPQPVGIYEATAGGTYEQIGDCSQIFWTKRMLVAELPGAAWKVLLPGEPPDYTDYSPERTIMDERLFEGAQLLG